MRKPLSVKTAFAGFGTPITTPAPTGGWNARDPLENMPVKDAVILDNLFPRAANVELRKGYQSFATLPTSGVGSLMGYKSPSGVVKLFAAASDGIYDCTAGGTIGAAATPGTSSDWHSSMMTTAGGNFLWCCNGVDACRYFNGTTWTLLNAGTLTGLAVTVPVSVSMFKKRLILTAVNSLSFYYLPLSSIAGAATEFPLGELFSEGGYLMATDSWTLDSGQGADDYFVAITSEGEIAVYKGTDPSSASTWALVGIFQVAKPLSRRCFVRVAGDLCVLTRTGLIPLSTLMQSSTLNRTKFVTDKISSAFTAFADRFGVLPGWQALLHTEAPMLLINAPFSADYSYQFVMNTTTGAWCRFINMYADCWVSFDGELYFGKGATVYKAWTGQNDNGKAIPVAAKQAFTDFESRWSKQATLIRPLFTANSSMSYKIGVDVDFDNQGLTQGATSYISHAAIWDQARWGEGTWVGSLSVAKWHTVSHMPGYKLALRLRMDLKDVTLSWNATNWVFAGHGTLD